MPVLAALHALTDSRTAHCTWLNRMARMHVDTSHAAARSSFVFSNFVRSRLRTGVQKLALTSMISEIRSATASMTSVPKPLKFLNTHIETLSARWGATGEQGAAIDAGGAAAHTRTPRRWCRCDALPVGENRSMLADVISVLATTVAPKEGERVALKYRLLGSKDNIDVWGHEYMRHLAGEICQEFNVSCDPGRLSRPCASMQACGPHSSNPPSSFLPCPTGAPGDGECR
jgi:hypothetical protein